MATMKLGRAELWFCAPGTPATGEARLFDLRTGKGTRRVWVRLVPSFLAPLKDGRQVFELFSQEELPLGLGAVLRRDDALYWRDEKTADEAAWWRQIGNVIVGRTTRVWQPEGDDRFGVALSETGEGSVFERTEGSSQRSGTSFRWHDQMSPEEFHCWPQRKFDSLLTAQFNNENSPLHRVYKWCGWNEDERTEHATRCENGTWDELCSLAQAVLILRFRQKAVRKRNNSHWDVFNPDPSDPDAGIFLLWKKLLFAVFRPFWFGINTPHYVSSHLNHLRFSLPQRVLKIPSAHEKLEAFLHLRDWAQQHVPDQAEYLLSLVQGPSA